MERKYIVSERAHLMCPNMQFAILATFHEKYQKAKIYRVMEQLSNAHSFLKCRIMKDQDGRYYYQFDEKQEISVSLFEKKEDFIQDYQQVAKKGWNVFVEPLLKMIAYPEEENCTIMFIAHHLLCDGRGLLGLVCEFADCYVKGIKPSFAEEHLLSSSESFSKKVNLPWISKCVINNVNKNWEKEHQTVSYKEYLAFERDYLNEEKTEWNLEKKSIEEFNEIKRTCKINKVSVNDYLVADMMMKENVKKVLIAADIRNYMSDYVSGSLGNYSTAFGVICKEKNRNLIDLAKSVSKKIHKTMKSPKKLFLVLLCYFKMNPELLDAVVISTLGSYKSKAGRFVGENMFGYKLRDGCSISNLGKIENTNIVEAVFLPPMSPAIRVMQGVLTVNNHMSICTGRKAGKNGNSRN